MTAWPKQCWVTVILLCGLFAGGLGLVVSGCERNHTTDPAGNTTSAASAPSETAPGLDTTVSSQTFPTFQEVWEACLGALEHLGPTRVQIVQTLQGRTTASGIPPSASTIGPLTEKAEQLLDIAGGRARLTVQTADFLVKTTVVKGREQLTLLEHPLRAPRTRPGLVTASRYIALEPPQGLPLALWAGQAVGPTEGFADLFNNEATASGEAWSTPAGGKVEPQRDGATRLTWTHSADGIASHRSLLLGPDHLPVRIDIDAAGTPESGDLQGMPIEYQVVIQYRFEQVASFSDSEFPLEIPAGAKLESTTYELDLERPWSDQANWEQYWLGREVTERPGGDQAGAGPGAVKWPLTRAEYLVHGSGAGAGTTDRMIILVYDRPAPSDPSANLQMLVKPLNALDPQQSLAALDRRVDSGDCVREQMTVAGRPATVHFCPEESGDGSRVGSIDILLPEAWITILVRGPFEPRALLSALTPIE